MLLSHRKDLTTEYTEIKRKAFREEAIHSGIIMLRECQMVRVGKSLP